MAEDIVEIIPQTYDVDIELAYATSKNFIGRPVYARAGCYLHKDAAAALATAAGLAAGVGLRFKVFDALRPQQAQWALWNHTPDPEFLADPRRGSPHSRGVAIDVTLVDGDGVALEMGTEFDAFTPLSHHGSTAVSSAAQHNRFTLLGIMTAAGWDHYRNEWWHYQLFSARDYALVDDADLPHPMM